MSPAALFGSKSSNTKFGSSSQVYEIQSSSDFSVQNYFSGKKEVEINVHRMFRSIKVLFDFYGRFSISIKKFTRNSV